MQMVGLYRIRNDNSIDTALNFSLPTYKGSKITAPSNVGMTETIKVLQNKINELSAKLDKYEVSIEEYNSYRDS